ncbi:MAG: sugar phosphate isomerase/epimerase [Pseudomonadota bacterium]
MPDTTRRTFLAMGGAAAATSMLPFPASAKSSSALPPGLQLWTVKDELAKDFAGTLKALKTIGYARVEAAGWVNQAPAAFRAGVADAGLECTSCHFGMRDLMTDSDADARLAAAKEVGVTYVVASSPHASRPMPGGMPWTHAVAQSMTLADWQANAERMNIVGAKARALGLRFGYHNHSAEFLMYDGKLAWGELLRITDPALVAFEVDIGWVAAAGVDPVEAIGLGGKRVQLLHIKDLASKQRTPHKLIDDETTVPIGKGTIDWKAVFAAADRHAAIHSWFVEQEAPFVQPPLAALAESIAYLNTLRA